MEIPSDYNCDDVRKPVKDVSKARIDHLLSGVTQIEPTHTMVKEPTVEEWFRFGAIEITFEAEKRLTGDELDTVQSKTGLEIAHIRFDKNRVVFQ